MSTENNDGSPRKLDAKDYVFFGVGGYILCLWGCGAVWFVYAMVTWAFPSLRTPPRSSSYSSRSYTPASYESYVPATPIPASRPTPRPAVDTDGTLQRMNALYAELYAKRKALDLKDSDAVEAFNKEAAIYQDAVKVFRSVRATQLKAIASSADSSRYIAPPAYSSTPVPYYGFQPPASSYSVPSTNDHYVSGYTRSDGTAVRGHYRTNRDHTIRNNYSTKGNVNPYTGRPGTVRY